MAKSVSPSDVEERDDPAKKQQQLRPPRDDAGQQILWDFRERTEQVRLYLKSLCVPNTVPIGYSDLGYSGRAAYSDLNPNGTWSSCIT